METDNYNKRSLFHDYRAPFIYHIIIKKVEKAPEFGFLRGSSKIQPGKPGSPYLFLSELGKSIFKGFELFIEEFEIFEKYRHCIMPDHIHIILYKKEWSEYHLDWYIEKLKEKMLINYLKGSQQEIKTGDIFKEKYTDKPLYDGVKLDNWFVYLNENPFRRLTIIQNRDFFNKLRNFKIGGRSVDLYGNLFLLTYPEKFAVRIRRHFTPSEIRTHYEDAVRNVAHGTVIISPFISKPEKAIREAVEANEGRIILIKHERLREGFKPPKHDFQLCSQGRLLIIYMGYEPKELNYQIATEMNEMAALITKLTFDTRLFCFDK